MSPFAVINLTLKVLHVSQGLYGCKSLVMHQLINFTLIKLSTERVRFDAMHKNTVMVIKTKNMLSHFSEGYISYYNVKISPAIQGNRQFLEHVISV